MIWTSFSEGSLEILKKSVQTNIPVGKDLDITRASISQKLPGTTDDNARTLWIYLPDHWDGRGPWRNKCQCYKIRLLSLQIQDFPQNDHSHLAFSETAPKLNIPIAIFHAFLFHRRFFWITWRQLVIISQFIHYWRHFPANPSTTLVRKLSKVLVSSAEWCSMLTS